MLFYYHISYLPEDSATKELRLLYDIATNKCIKVGVGGVGVDYSDANSCYKSS